MLIPSIEIGGYRGIKFGLHTNTNLHVSKPVVAANLAQSLRQWVFCCLALTLPCYGIQGKQNVTLKLKSPIDYGKYILSFVSGVFLRFLWSITVYGTVPKKALNHIIFWSSIKIVRKGRQDDILFDMDPLMGKCVLAAGGCFSASQQVSLSASSQTNSLAFLLRLQIEFQCLNCSATSSYSD